MIEINSVIRAGEHAQRTTFRVFTGRVSFMLMIERVQRYVLRQSWALTVILVTIPAVVIADASFSRGEALYENHCGSCHDRSVHLRGNRRVDSREELRGWVASWSVHANVDWDDEDVESVTGYLSRWLYGFEQ